MDIIFENLQAPLCVATYTYLQTFSLSINESRLFCFSINSVISLLITSIISWFSSWVIISSANRLMNFLFRFFKTTICLLILSLFFWESLQEQIMKKIDYETFFSQAPRINPNAAKITGVICGHRVEKIEDPLMQKIRCLDKLIDELAKGKPMEKILRSWISGCTHNNNQLIWR